MRVVKSFPLILAIVSLLVTCFIFHSVFRAMTWASSPPAWFVSPTSQKIEVEPGDGKVIANYRVTNRGGRDLVLGEVSTTCGCTVASIERKILKQGESSLITVEGTPPGAGERIVEIGIATNARPEANLHFRLTMIGKKPLPYVANSSGDLQFGFVREGMEPEVVWIETREIRQQKPWFCATSCSIPGLDVKGGFEVERPFAGEVVFRRYSYRIELKESRSPGEFSGELYLKGRDPNAGPNHRVHIHGIVRPPVYSAPSSLYVNHKAGAPSWKMTIRFCTADPKFRLIVAPPADIPKPVSVHRIPNATGEVLFEIVLDGELSQSIRSTLAFETNHPDSKIVQVPLTLNLVFPRSRDPR